MNRQLAIGLGASVAVVAAGGAVVVLAWPSPEPGPTIVAGVTTLPPEHHRPPDIQATLSTLDLAPGSNAVPERHTKRFSLVGVTWNDPKAAPRGTVEVRTRSIAGGKWSGWQVLDTAEVDESSTRGATEPLWAGPSDGVAARIVPASGAATALPAGLRLDLVDPGRRGGQGGGDPVPSEDVSPDILEMPESPSVEPATSESTAPPTPTTPPPATTPPTTVPATTPATTLPTPTSTAPLITPLPPYVTRAQWSADETIVREPISVASDVRVLFVHHTAETNTYSCADSPSIVRAIQSYHVKSRGWADIGYNFLVDKCGRLFEGRRGGVTQAVIGAHTYGFNTNSAGIAVLGNYSTAASPAAAELTIAQVAAARLGAYKFNPNTRAQLTEAAPDGKFKPGQVVTFARVSGHRDGVVTECPGDNLYDRLPAIRALALNVVSGLTGSLAGGTLSGGVYHVRTKVTLNWTLSTPAASLARFDVLLDGKVAATLPGTARTTRLPVAAGAHTVAVRAVHISGATATTPAAKVVADITAPTFPGTPNVVLRGGTYATTYAPVAVTFRAADNVRVASLAATLPVRATLGPAWTVWNAGVRPGAATNFSLTARDLAGNARTAAVQRKALLVAETGAKRTGTWTARAGGAYLNAKALAATKANARLTYTFTGRSAALLFSRGAKTGRAYVYLDGKKVATIDTRLSANAYRQALWVRTLTPGKHTVAVVAAGTGGRPTVVADGLAYIP